MVRYDDSMAERGSKYVRDGRDGPRGRAGGRGGGKVVGGGLGLIIALLAALFGFGDVLGGGTGGSGFPIDASAFPDSNTGPVSNGVDATVDPQADTYRYMEFLMGDIQDTWDEYFTRAGLAYQYTTLYVFDDVVSTGCGQATSGVGPFYCPAPGDNQVYIDFSFFDELASPRFGAAGDFAQAYVVAHEVGHHIQYLTGISDAVRKAQSQDPANANEYSIRMELQADCLAGVWAYSASNRLTDDTGLPIIEPGDIQEGLNAATAVGDDRLQAQAGISNPESWTHGSSAQRVKWFTVGFDSGDPEQCDTFAVANA